MPVLAWAPLGRGLPAERGPSLGRTEPHRGPAGRERFGGSPLPAPPPCWGPPRGGRVPRGVDALGTAAQAAPGKLLAAEERTKGAADTPPFALRDEACSALERGGQAGF